MNFDDTMDAYWCIDSETGREILVDRKTCQIIAIKNEKGEYVDAE